MLDAVVAVVVVVIGVVADVVVVIGVVADVDVPGPSKRRIVTFLSKVQ